jgi:hypothetical protein
MDYAPIWMFLLKTKNDSKNDIENWEITKIYFDRFHYFIGKEDPKHLTKVGNRYKFEIKNTWHSINPVKNTLRYKILNVKIPIKSRNVLIIFLFILLGLLGFLTFVSWGQSYLMILQSLIILLMMYGIHSFNNYKICDLIDENQINEMTDNEKYRITEEKIKTLWNLNDRKSQLIIKKKIFDPFGSEWEQSTWDK